MKGIFGFIIWMIIGYLSGKAFDFSGFIDILFWPVCVVYLAWKKLNGED